MESIWTKDVCMPEFPKLETDIRTGVLIIGGGMTGILCAYFLQQAGVDYCLLEAEKICRGITGSTTAKITSQQGLQYDKLLRKEGLERASLYLKANEQAKKHYRDLGWFIDCDMKEEDAYVYSRNDRNVLEQEITALGKLGYAAEFVEHPNLPFETAGAVRVRHQLQFHPLKFVAEIAKNLRIYEDSPVREMTEHLCLTPGGSVTAEKVIVATHFPILNKRGSYYLKLYQERAYVLALENAPAVDGMYIDAVHGGLSFRNYRNYLLVGGKSHRTGKPLRLKDGEEKTLCGLNALKEEVQDILPEARIAAEWAAQDCMSLDGMPYIGKYSRRTPELFVGTGYSKWGMTGSMLAAMVLTDLVQERENEYAGLLSTSRSMLKPQLAKNAWHAATGILRLTGKQRCTHMGCVLQWNAGEKTWECPCHGSRFDAEGNILDNPTMRKLKNETEEK